MLDLLCLPADRAPTVVLDLETTGLDPAQGHRVIEIALIRVEDGQQRQFSSLVHPGMPIPAEGRAIHGIDDQMVLGAPRFEELTEALESMIDGAVLVAHNASFDLAFLESEYQRLGRPLPRPVAVADTLTLARTVFGLVHCGLSALAARIGVPHDAPHRALPDAQATLGVYQAMLQAAREPEVPTVGELLDLTTSLQQGGSGRRQIRQALREAWHLGKNVVIDYTSGAGGELTTRREITITDLRPPYVEAVCHLREAPRVFKVSRIRRVLPVRDQEDSGDGSD